MCVGDIIACTFTLHIITDTHKSIARVEKPVGNAIADDAQIRGRYFLFFTVQCPVASINSSASELISYHNLN
jgi:hypothetical protein